VPKVHNKPIKRPRKGSNKKSKRQPKCALVWRTGLSGVPPDSVRCTRELDSKLLTFGNFGARSAIIHRTVRCSTGLSDVPAEKRLLHANGRLQRQLMRYSARRSQSTVRRRTGQSTGPVWCTTGLSGAPYDSSLHQTTSLVVGAINTPNHPPFIASKFSAFKHLTRAIAFNTRHNQSDQILSQVQRSFQSNSDS
jgi:hypothetical protein